MLPMVLRLLRLLASLNDAQELQRQQECHAIVLLPENFAQQINRGEQGTVLFYADLSGCFTTKECTLPLLMYH